MGRIIGLKAGDIKGDVSVTGAKDNISCYSVTTGAHASITYDSDGGGDVGLSTVALVLKYGDWVGDLQKALFAGQVFKEVSIVEIDQKNADQGNAEAKLVRTMKLTNAHLESVGISWIGQEANVSVSFAFEKWDLTYEAKSGAKMASRDLMATS